MVLHQSKECNLIKEILQWREKRSFGVIQQKSFKPSFSSIQHKLLTLFWIQWSQQIMKKGMNYSHHETGNEFQPSQNREGISAITPLYPLFVLYSVKSLIFLWAITIKIWLSSVLTVCIKWIIKIKKEILSHTICLVI